MKEKLLIEIEYPEENHVSINTEINFEKKFYALIIRTEDIQNLELTEIAVGMFLRDVFPNWDINTKTVVKFAKRKKE
jgi:hypothetical protein